MEKIAGPAAGDANDGAASERNSLRVAFYTAPSRLQNPGGGEVQLLKTAEALCARGVAVRLMDPWTDLLERFQWLHLFGMCRESLAMATLAKRRGVKVALSPICWYDPAASWHLEPTLALRVKALAGWAARRMVRSVPSWRQQLLHCVDLLLPNSVSEARQLASLFDLGACLVRVVPNGVEERFMNADPARFSRQFQLDRYVLAPGRIEPRKNQLALIRALWGSGLTLVLLGDPHSAHMDYYEQCRRESGPDVRFIDRLGHDSELLASAYAGADAVVLASWYETPGLAALEAALAGTPVVVTARGSAREYFGSLARYVQPDDLGSIRRQVRAAVAAGKSSQLQQHVRCNFLWQHVAESTLAAYRDVDVTAADRGAGRQSRLDRQPVTEQGLCASGSPAAVRDNMRNF